MIHSPENLVIVGTPGDDELGGGSGNDFLNGISGNDTFYGHGGDDTLVGAGPGWYDGGDGIDTVVLNVSREEVLSYAFTPAHVETVLIANGADTDTFFRPAVLDVSSVLGHPHIVACERVMLKDGYFVLDTLPLYTVQTYFLAGAGRLATLDELSWWVRESDSLSAQGIFTEGALAGLMLAHYSPDATAGEVYDTLAAHLNADGTHYLPDRTDALAQVAAGTMTVGSMAAFLAAQVSHPQLSGYDLNSIQELDLSYFI